MEYITKYSNGKSASVHSAFTNRVTLTLMPCSLNMAGFLHSKSILLTYFEKKKKIQTFPGHTEIFMDWFHDKESINNDPRQTGTKKQFYPYSKANKKMNCI